MKMKRILHFLPNLDVSSGSTTVVMNYYRKINRENIQFDFLYFEDSKTDYIDEVSTLGGRVFKIDRPDFSKESICQLQTFFKMHQGDWEILHCHPVYAAVVIGSIAKKNGIKHVIQHSHSSKFGNTKKSGIRNFIISRLNPLVVTDYFACSLEAAKLLGWRFVWKDKVKILHNAIDCERFKFNINVRNDIRKEYQIAEDTVVIGHSGRFSVEKNHQYLLDVFLHYHKFNPNSKLMLLGDGSEKENICNFILKNGLEKDVILLGRQKQPENYLCAMDMFVFPSFYEGISLALIEAQCSGLCCYVSDCVDIKSKQLEEYYTFSLSTPASEVANSILHQPLNLDRIASYNKIKESKFNLFKEAQELETYYMKLSM